jgi:hypothetical protein
VLNALLKPVGRSNAVDLRPKTFVFSVATSLYVLNILAGERGKNASRRDGDEMSALAVKGAGEWKRDKFVPETRIDEWRLCRDRRASWITWRLMLPHFGAARMEKGAIWSSGGVGWMRRRTSTCKTAHTVTPSEVSEQSSELHQKFGVEIDETLI